MKAALKKTTRIGRTTALLVALAVVLALTAGVADAAMAKKKGKSSLKLGVKNAVEAVTSMAGTLADPILRLDNNGTGPALDLQVESGKAPLTVNAEAGTATNLSADELDGKDSTAFMSETYQVFKLGTSRGGGFIDFVTAACDSGDEVLGGGGGGSFLGDDVLISEPNSQTSWQVGVRSQVNNTGQIKTTAICADRPPLR